MMTAKTIDSYFRTELRRINRERKRNPDYVPSEFDARVLAYFERKNR